MKKLYLLPLLCLFFVFPAHSQKQKKEKLEEHSFMMKDITYLSDSMGAAILEYADSKKAGLAFVNDKGAVLKELDIPGKVLGIARRKGNVLLFYVNQWDKEVDVTKDLHAVLVDAVSKSIIADKVIFKNRGDIQLECLMGKDCNEEFSYMLVRVTTLKGVFGNNVSEKESRAWGLTSSIEAITLSDNLEPVSHSFSGAASSGYLISTVADRKGNVTILTHANGLLTAEKYGPNGELIKKITQPMEMNEKRHWLYYQPIVKYDPANDNRFAISIRHSNAKDKDMLLSLFLFDFAAGKSISGGTAILNKDFQKELAKDPQMQNAKQFRDIQDLTPASLDFVGDKLVVCNEEQGVWFGNTNSSVGLYFSQGAIVTIYDAQLRPQHRLFIYRDYECYNNLGRGYSSWVRNGKVQLLGNEVWGPAKYGSFCYTIDPEKGTIERKETDWGPVMREDPLDIRSVFWFPKNQVVSHMAGNHFFGHHVDCYINTVPYLP